MIKWGIILDILHKVEDLQVLLKKQLSTLLCGSETKLNFKLFRMRPLYSLLKKELKFTEEQSENSFNFQKDQRTLWNIHKIVNICRMGSYMLLYGNLVEDSTCQP